MSAPISPELVKVIVRNLYTGTELIFVGQAHEVLGQLLEVFAWLHPSPPTVLALERIVDLIDREQCFNVEIDIVSAKRSSP